MAQKTISYRKHPRRTRASFASVVILFIGILGVIGIVCYLNNIAADPPPPAPEIKEIYIAELDRDVPWMGQINCYYDAQTRCRFYLNEESDPGFWMYRFDDIAAEYGDYGWMKWDDSENCWYIQTDSEVWEPLPEKYSRIPLWHMK